MEMVEVSLGMWVLLEQSVTAIHALRTGWIKRLFPEFEFTWLGGEMRENLPKEMDFSHEARNAWKAEQDFENIRTSLYIRAYHSLIVHHPSDVLHQRRSSMQGSGC